MLSFSRKVQVRQLVLANSTTGFLAALLYLLAELNWFELGAWAIPIALILFTLQILIFSISRSNILSGLRELSLLAKAVAQGNLDAKLKIQSEDEFAEIGKQFNKAATRLDRILEDVSKSGEKLVSLSAHVDQLSAETQQSADILDERSNRIASTIEELSTTMQHVGDKFLRVQENAEKANRNSDTAQNFVTEIGEELRRVQGAVKQFDRNFESVEASAQNIDGFAKIIDDNKRSNPTLTRAECMLSSKGAVLVIHGSLASRWLHNEVRSAGHQKNARVLDTNLKNYRG